MTLARCSVGLMKRSLRCICSEPFEDFITSCRSTLKMLVSSFARAFDSICVYHENSYLEGYGTPSFDLDNKHRKRGSPSQKWLLPRHFALACCGKLQ